MVTYTLRHINIILSHKCMYFNTPPHVDLMFRVVPQFQLYLEVCKTVHDLMLS